MTERRIGPFILGRQIGAGGMGIVYLATYTETGKQVALKVLPPSLSDDEKLLKRFEREIGILKRLKHPNIVKYYGGGTHQGQRWYAMEYIDGGSLFDILQKRKRLTWDQAIQVGRQLTAALEHAHNAGIIHRDLKPGNLFVSKKGHIKLGDFGIARDTEATALTAAGKTIGTYAYMAPEQIHGNAAISRKTDLYATGCLLYELLTGETPFVSTNPAELLMMHLNDYPYNLHEKNVDCPLALDQLVERLLQKDQEDRPFDALAVNTELEQILKSGDDPVSDISHEALHSPGASKSNSESVSIDPVTGDVTVKKKKKKDQSQFYEKTWFLLAFLGLLIAVGVWLSLPAGEDTLYIKAKEAMSTEDPVAHFDARGKYLRPYMERFPQGKYASEMRDWLDDAEVSLIEAQLDRRVKRQDDGRNAYETACLKAMRAVTDSERNALEALEIFQSLIESLPKNDSAEAEPAKLEAGKDAIEIDESTDVIKVPRFWKTIAEKKRNAAKLALLSDPDRFEIITERMTTANELVASGKKDAGDMIFHLFREVFYGEKELEDWLDYAKARLHGDQIEMPAQHAATDADGNV
ncbi:MAG: serine/threonine-protein kinase [Planctomycetota bacterium]|nr:serine/threonine-protein kinase [Planctomycetota bacterium]